jgi:hypothetical protein
MATVGSQTSNDICKDCAALNISAHKFNRNAKDSSLPNSDGFDDKGLEAINIGFLDEFYRRRDRCPFCRLVYDATYDEDGHGIGHDGLNREGERVPCWMDWQLDGRSSAPHEPFRPVIAALTRRLRLYSKSKYFQACFLVPLREELEMAIPSFQARPVQPEQVNIVQLRSWLALCEKHHEQCCEQKLQVEMSQGLRLINVHSMRLVETTSTQRYTTLSYCWGKTQFYCLSKENYEELTRSGLREKLLSKTIKEAIRLVSALGEDYIWIDALCIIQDSAEDWQMTAPLMDKIYGNSILTICAASGDDSEQGLSRAQKSSRPLWQSIQNCSGLNLLAFQGLEERIQHCPWNSRAWTFQERLLSRRCLIFVDDRVFFQCRKVTWSEELDCESSALFWTLDAINSPLNLFNENPLRRYSKSVELYSGRNLSRQTDRLVAFEGIAVSLAQQLGSSTTPFQYGLPTSFFDWALLWESKTPTQRIPGDKSWKVFFPSWSWCGWRGSSEWRMSTTSSVLLNLHEWLMKHTWIIWYIGNYSQHQLVFHAEAFKSSPMPGRWAGYARDEATSLGKFGHNSDPDQDSYGRLLNSPSHLRTEPTLPPIEGHLHFYTWSAYFKLSRQSMSDSSFKSNLQPGLHRFSILDCRSDWCGTIVLDESYYNQVSAVFEFIAISEARDFALEEYDSWTYYVPGEREEAEWYLYYALMIKVNAKSGTSERLGLAKIYTTAFQSGSFDPGFKWKEIRLG